MNDDFRPAWWLRGPHAQTMFGPIVRRRARVRFRREAIETPDGDELLLDHLDAPVTDGRFRFLLMHGLEGSSYSVYIQGVLALLASRGFAATALNFRSCAREPRRLGRMLPNRKPRFYHSGETTDFDFVARTLAARDAQTPLLAFGASLAGNVLLKWLGEHPGQKVIHAAAALSVPYDLGAGSRFMESRMGLFYVGRFLATLKDKVHDVVKRFPETAERIDVAAVRRARTFREFDDAATGPLHGFTGADDYYTRSSSIHFLPHITTPTLCLNAEDDPFLPREALQRARRAASPAIDFRTTKHGGHTGFIAGPWPWRPDFWAERVAVDWLVAHGG